MALVVWLLGELVVLQVLMVGHREELEPLLTRIPGYSVVEAVQEVRLIIRLALPVAMLCEAGPVAAAVAARAMRLMVLAAAAAFRVIVRFRRTVLTSALPASAIPEAAARAVTAARQCRLRAAMVAYPGAAEAVVAQRSTP
jgi:hypothetical protein